MVYIIGKFVSEAKFDKKYDKAIYKNIDILQAPVIEWGQIVWNYPH